MKNNNSNQKLIGLAGILIGFFVLSVTTINTNLDSRSKATSMAAPQTCIQLCSSNTDDQKRLNCILDCYQKKTKNATSDGTFTGGDPIAPTLIAQPPLIVDPIAPTITTKQPPLIVDPIAPTAKVEKTNCAKGLDKATVSKKCTSTTTSEQYKYVAYTCLDGSQGTYNGNVCLPKTTLEEVAKANCLKLSDSFCPKIMY